MSSLHDSCSGNSWRHVTVHHAIPLWMSLTCLARLWSLGYNVVTSLTSRRARFHGWRGLDCSELLTRCWELLTIIASGSHSHLLTRVLLVVLRSNSRCETTLGTRISISCHACFSHHWGTCLLGIFSSLLNGFSHWAIKLFSLLNIWGANISLWLAVSGGANFSLLLNSSGGANFSLWLVLDDVWSGGYSPLNLSSTRWSHRIQWGSLLGLILVLSDAGRNVLFVLARYLLNYIFSINLFSDSLISFDHMIELSSEFLILICDDSNMILEGINFFL